ncbi:MAG: hypothetical protein LBD31_01560 [Treponema sp.]|nr:hypothetical protein [Treponema sp.]
MAKKWMVCLVLAALIAGGVFAQEGGFGFESGGVGALLAVPSADFDGGLELVPLAAGSGGGFLTGNRFAAGALNLPLGLWSWLNRDWLGGALTAGLEGAGIVLVAMGAGEGGSTISIILGIGVGIGGAVYGFRRGWRECGKIQQAQSLAEALRENPLKHVSLAAAPNGEGGMAGVLVWQASW